MDAPPIPFVWSDAWLLLALVLADRDNRRATLRDVIAYGDAVQHAVFTHAEFSGGARRLVDAGFAKLDQDALQPTPTGRALVDKSLSSGTALLHALQTLERSLNARPYPAQALADTSAFISEAVFDAAVALYLLDASPMGRHPGP